MTDVLIKRGNLDLDTHRENTIWRLVLCCHELKNYKDCWQERLGTGSPSQLGSNQPCWHLDFRPLASRALREWISVVLATALVVPCYSSPSRLAQVLWRTTGHHSWMRWEKVKEDVYFLSHTSLLEFLFFKKIFIYGLHWILVTAYWIFFGT